MCVGHLDACQMRAGSCFGNSFSPKCPDSPTPPPHFISFSLSYYPPRSILPCSQESLPWGRGYFNVGSSAKAIREPDSSTLPHTYTHIHTEKHTHTVIVSCVLSDLTTWHACSPFPSIILHCLTTKHYNPVDKNKWGKKGGRVTKREPITATLKLHKSVFFSL